MPSRLCHGRKDSYQSIEADKPPTNHHLHCSTKQNPYLLNTKSFPFLSLPAYLHKKTMPTTTSTATDVGASATATHDVVIIGTGKSR